MHAIRWMTPWRGYAGIHGLKPHCPLHDINAVVIQEEALIWMLAYCYAIREPILQPAWQYTCIIHLLWASSTAHIIHWAYWYWPGDKYSHLHKVMHYDIGLRLVKDSWVALYVYIYLWCEGWGVTTMAPMTYLNLHLALVWGCSRHNLTADLYNGNPPCTTIRDPPPVPSTGQWSRNPGVNAA